MGAANFGHHFLKKIDLVALPVDEAVFIKENQREMANWNDLSAEEQAEIVREQQETDFKFTVTNIKDFIAEQNELLRYCKLLIMDGYHEGIQIGLKVIENQLLELDQYEVAGYEMLNQSEIDERITEELMTLKQTIIQGQEHGLEPALVQRWIAPIVYQVQSQDFQQLLTDALQTLANDEFYERICPKNTIANHSEQVVKQVMTGANKTYQR